MKLGGGSCSGHFRFCTALALDLGITQFVSGELESGNGALDLFQCLLAFCGQKLLTFSLEFGQGFRTRMSSLVDQFA